MLRSGLIILFGMALAAPLSAAVVKIEKTAAGGYRLLRDGKAFFVRGAVGFGDIDGLPASGGNAIRTGPAALDRVHKLGLAALVNLPLGKQRQGFDYLDRDRVARQLEQVREIVRKYKDHPAVLMWAIGNEPEIRTTPEERRPLWKAVNEIAEMIHREDPNHPAITVVGGQYRQMLHEVKEQCPALDAVGLNAYADMLTQPEDVAKQGWDKAYLVTEFGPRGHWQVRKTPWGMPIEETSTEKAEFYLKAYRHAVENRPQCLGSFVFLWVAKRHEKTHTWYNMFLEDGSRLGAVDAMSYAWTGKWPGNRCPRIDGRIALGPGVRLKPGAEIRCEVQASDPDGDALTYAWELRRDVSDDPNVGGDKEEPTPPIAGAVVSSDGNRAVLRAPEAPGHYRIFVYIHDGKGNAAVANEQFTTR